MDFYSYGNQERMTNMAKICKKNKKKKETY